MASGLIMGVFSNSTGATAGVVDLRRAIDSAVPSPVREETMGSFGRILAPTDLELRSDAGLRFAAGLARDEGASLVVLHVLSSKDLELDDMSHHRQHLREAAFAAASQRLEGVVERVIGSGVAVERRVVFGTPGYAVRDVAREEGCDLVVITVKNRSRVGKLLMGSQAQEILLSAERPVLCIHND